ncbi:elongation factor P 5-aminopentanone reductase [Gracilibacillus alcaliphilus]|uniref:elongation factor P 5-aminopentanone reductase n=1 Tax=Gracilibacillus alcaliphilus TaxID=1401441 RepID=UPI001959A8D0|nr:SDR family oxidoreductase [Gracilibacillus alcaliphilus]MBM7676624.1 3-oxoacyl-[acyl-carrier protein] reductase [Gracilibacillus alcaliphilus]
MEKKILITGASGEIGQAIAKDLAKAGHSLVLHYHKNQTDMDRLTKQIPADQCLQVIQADLSTPEGLQQFLSVCPPDIDYYIHTSGQSVVGLFQDMPDQQMDELLHLHIKAPWRITQHLIPSMIRQQSGRIVVISSIWGEVGASCEVAYSTVKGAQNTFVKALAKELGPSQIYVNGVSPGLIDTKMNQHLDQQERDALIEEIALQRIGLPEDVARAVCFLCEEQTRYIQGELIKVDGGW